jgi:hypothetical protein
MSERLALGVGRRSLTQHAGLAAASGRLTGTRGQYPALISTRNESRLLVASMIRASTSAGNTSSRPVAAGNPSTSTPGPRVDRCPTREEVIGSAAPPLAGLPRHPQLQLNFAEAVVRLRGGDAGHALRRASIGGLNAATTPARRFGCGGRIHTASAT